MKRKLVRLLAIVLSAILCLQMSEFSLALAASEGLDPASQSVPEELQDGNNYFFIKQSTWTISEKSKEPLYVPVQRSGNLDEEAEVTLKVIDLSARHDVNYTMEVCGSDVEPEIVVSDTSLLEVVKNADGVSEEETPTEADLGAMLQESGGAQIVDTEGNAIGSVTAAAVNENGDAQQEPAEDAGDASKTSEDGSEAAEQTEETVPAAEPAEEAAPADPEEPADEAAAEETAGMEQIPAGENGPALLQFARNAFTGTYSDRQEMQEPDAGLQGFSMNSEEDGELSPSQVVEDSYPGREYRLHFEAGQDVQLLKFTALYSEENDGDSQVMLNLKDPSENMMFPEQFGPTAVTILNEDEPEPVVISMKEETITARDGVASITVTRSGRLKSIAGAHIASWDGSAVQGKDYGGVGADLYFPMGISERTIELPVGHGPEEKDFNVTLTPLTGEEISTATAHVIIPPAEIVQDTAAVEESSAEGEESAELMAASGTQYGDPVDLKSLWDCNYERVDWHSNYSFSAETPDDTTWKQAGIDFKVPDRYGYFYDGMRIDHRMYANFCKARTHVSLWSSSKEWYGDWDDDYTGEGVRDQYQLNYYYGSEKSPGYMHIACTNRKNTGWAWTDDYCRLTVYSVQPILRRFDITVEDAEALKFEGMTDEEVLKQYEEVNPNGNGNKNFSIWSGGNFTINRPSGVSQPRLVGVDAVRASDGETWRLATIDGKSNSVKVELTQDIVNYLGKNNYIKWSSDKGEGSPKTGSSYTGGITVRPVFEYEDVKVDVRDTPYGALLYNGKKLEEGTYTFHKGDKLVFEPNLSDRGMGDGVRATGVGFIARKDNKSGALQDQNPCEYYLNNQDFPVSKYPNGAREFILKYDYYEFWQVFSAESNGVRVRVPQDETQYFDTSKGLFEGLTPERVQGYDVYTVKQNVLNNELTALSAVMKDGSRVPVWTLSGSKTKYSGSVFYFNTGITGEDNLITLRTDGNEADHAQYMLSGSVYSSTMNLASGEKAADMIPAENAVVTMGLVQDFQNMAVTDPSGFFKSVAAETLLGGSSVRYTVTYNGVISVQETKLPDASSPKETVTVTDSSGTSGSIEAISVSAGSVRVDNYSMNGAHFTSAFMTQDGVASGLVDAMKMNGKKLDVRVHYDLGQSYLCDGESRTENIKDIVLYFQNQYTGETHGVYSAASGKYAPDNSGNLSGVTLNWDQQDRTVALEIEKFSPDQPGSWTYGDVLMARMITDKQEGASSWSGSDMNYDPVSTGYAVYTDLDYVPETFQYDIDNLAEQLQFGSEEEGGLTEETRYSFGEFPYLGEILATVHVFTTLASFGGDGTAQQIVQDVAADADDEEDDAGIENGSYDSASDGLKDKEKKDSGWTLNVYFTIQKTAYGGMRFLIGVAFTTGSGTGYKYRNHPYKNARAAQQMFFGSYRARMMNTHEPEAAPSASALQPELIHSTVDHLKMYNQSAKSAFGGMYFSFGIYFGLYLDYGYIRETNVDGENTDTKTGEMVFMGAGGFVSFKGSVGVNIPFWFLVPMYFVPEASIDVSFFIGSSANPVQTLSAFNNGKEHSGQDFQFNVEILGTVKAGATLGIGVYKILGGRIYVGVGFDVGYGMNMAEWYPNIGTDWGTSLYAEFSGSVDLVFTSISLYSASFPLTGSGWMDYVETVTMSNRLIGYVNKGIDDRKGSAEARARCREKITRLEEMIDSNQYPEAPINSARKDLLDYAYDEDVISQAQYYSAIVKAQGGIAGAIMNKVLEEAEAEKKDFYVRDHVDADWKGGQDADLMSAFSPVASSKLVEDAFTQTSAQIQPIGNDRYLVVFLSDDNSREKMQASVLQYNIYDASKDQFLYDQPKTVQNDGTADGKPSLIDAGDNKLVLSWASTEEGKYNELKASIAEGLGVDVDDKKVTEALEADPARVMACMDIFTAEFDKQEQSFGEITQLTDDVYCDDYPQAVYDSESEDYMVLYYKTAQNDEAYTDPAEKLKDLAGVNADPKKTYSMLCYMIHNGSEDEDGAWKTNDEKGTVPAGWVTDYLYENEISDETRAYSYGEKTGVEAFLEAWGGQRFLPSALREEDGGQTDAPIADLTVCNGYNGLAAFSFTVDKDLNLETVEDKELYLQFYDFSSHSTYVPVRIAGDQEELVSSSTAMLGGEMKTVSRTRQVNVGQPKLVHTGGSTWLFWKEDGGELRYLNVSDMLNDKVGSGSDESGWTHAVQPDGSFAVDPETGEAYKPDIQTVDFGGQLSDGKMNLAEYQVVTDKDDNIYVIWTQNGRYTVEDELLDRHEVTCQEVYATARIKEEDQAVEMESGDGEQADVAVPCRWSKPYRLTRDNTYNDGLAVALDEDGGLIILHNQYEKLFADSAEKMLKLVEEGKAGLEQREDGTYFKGSLYYDSPISLMLTRCDAVGSVEATNFQYSDLYPVAGEKVRVTSLIENTGLTTAEGYRVDYYEYKNGKRGKKLFTVDKDENLPVNSCRKARFLWEVPEEGAEGYSIQAVAQEGNYAAVNTYSDPFEAAPAYDIAIDSIRQNGDKFDVKYHIRNVGNKAAEEGTTASICLRALYGELKETYGMDTDILTEKDISGLKPRETKTVEESISIPVSVFEFCGYDAVELDVCDSEGGILEATSDDYFVSMDEPVNLMLNNGNRMTLEKGETAEAGLTYDTTVFIENDSVLYSVDDPSVASVDEEGKVTALGSGTTKLTATMLPSGRSVSINLKVGEEVSDCPKDDSCPMTKFTDADKSQWYHDGVHWALEEGVMNGTGEKTFEPETAANRAMFVTMLWRMEGSPEVDENLTFKDVPDGKWYTDAVKWAVKNGITSGYSEDEFAPEDSLKREQIVTFLYRYAKLKDLDVSSGETASLDAYTDAAKISDWADKAFRWAVDAGIINGVGDQKLDPQGQAVRAQVATMLMRYSRLP